MRSDFEIDAALGMSRKERQALQQQAIDEDDGAWERELRQANMTRGGVDNSASEGRTWKEVNAMRSRRNEGYKMLEEMNECLAKLERHYEQDNEIRILRIAAEVVEIEGLSPHQTSLAIKRLADYYYSEDNWLMALDHYEIGYRLNPKLPVKRRIEELSSEAKTQYKPI